MPTLNDATEMTAKEILALTPTRHGVLFAGLDRTATAAQFRRLAKRWHPDRNGGSSEAAAVFARIVDLHEAALRALHGGPAADPDVLRIETVEGRAFALRYRRRTAFELGETFVADGRVAYVVGKEHAALFENGLRMIGGVTYPDARTKADLSRFMPPVERLLETATDRIAVIRKTDDVFMLSDLVAALGGRMDPRHVAWLISSLLNLTCFFSVSGFVHNALTPTTVFVSPKYHAAFPLGGWWYAAQAGARMTSLPDETYSLLPRAVAADKRADIRLDLESVRAIGRAALGDPSGVSFAGRPGLPRPMADYLRLPGSGSAVEDYRTWERVLKDSFGPRRFVELPVTSSDVYT